MKRSRFLALILALVLMLGAFSGCAVEPVTDLGTIDPGGTSYQGQPDTDKDAAPTMSNLVEVESYGEIYDLLFEGREGYGDMNTGAVVEDAMVEMPESEMPADEPAEDSADSSAGGDYSGTNVQTEGIDEGDVVKTDGEYIYVLKEQTRVIVLKAEGTDTRKIADIQVADGYFYEENNGNYTKETYASQMYLSGDKLVVIVDTYEWTKTESDFSYKDNQKVTARIYDVSDPSSPVFVTEVGQQGRLADSRLDENTLYLVSSYYVWDSVRDDERTYIPEYYNGDEPELMPIEHICIPVERNGTGWSVVSAIDTATGEIKATHAVMGETTKIYMSRDNIYILSGGYDEGAGEPYTEDQYKVTEYAGKSETTIVKYGTAGGTLEYTQTATVPGYIESQFSLDEHEGKLRLVVTESWNSYRLYTDEKRGWSNYEHIDSGTYASLFVLDEGLNIIGEVTGLGEDERIYSARFDGDIAYFVTFRETDPLFAVDLSDPTAPKVLSALKIPGFSEYLHFYGEGRLFGLGMSVDEENGWTEYLKLSMFDTSDPADVTEKTVLELENYTYSPALYDHHAALISVERDVIAFPTDGNYLIYGYTDTAGFVKKGEVPVEAWGSNTRGLYIGEYMYICDSNNVKVVSMADYSVLKDITI